MRALVDAAGRCKVRTWHAEAQGVSRPRQGPGHLATGLEPVERGRPRPTNPGGVTDPWHEHVLAAPPPPRWGLGSVVRRIPRAHARGYMPSPPSGATGCHIASLYGLEAHYAPAAWLRAFARFGGLRRRLHSFTPPRLRDCPAVRTVDLRVVHRITTISHPRTYRSSYWMPCRLRKATNSS